MTMTYLKRKDILIAQLSAKHDDSLHALYLPFDDRIKVLFTNSRERNEMYGAKIVA